MSELTPTRLLRLSKDLPHDWKDIAGERSQGDIDARKIADGRGEAFAQGVEIWERAGVKVLLEEAGEFGLAGLLMSEGEKLRHDAAGVFFGLPRQQQFEDARIGATRKKLIPVDEIEQRHGLA